MRQGGGTRVQVEQLEQGEQALLRRVGTGDRLAFQALYRSYFTRLARFLDRMLRNPALIEEVVNDTMLVVWQKANTFDGSCKLSTWIFGIAYRLGLKAIGSIDEPIEAEQELWADATDQPEQLLQSQQLQAGVARALDSLPLEQRVVVSLTYFHGMAYQEIADTMGCPLNTVKTRMFHARLKLKDILSEHREEIR